ncbi:hypothetical protein MKX03_006223, partial [Papaver bracteatum]
MVTDYPSKHNGKKSSGVVNRENNGDTNGFHKSCAAIDIAQWVYTLGILQWILKLNNELTIKI